MPHIQNESIKKLIAVWPSGWKSVVGGIGFEAWEVTTSDGVFNVEIELQDPSNDFE